MIWILHTSAWTARTLYFFLLFFLGVFKIVTVTVSATDKSCAIDSFLTSETRSVFENLTLIPHTVCWCYFVCLFVCFFTKGSKSANHNANCTDNRYISCKSAIYKVSRCITTHYLSTIYVWVRTELTADGIDSFLTFMTVFYCYCYSWCLILSLISSSSTYLGAIDNEGFSPLIMAAHFGHRGVL